MALTKVSRGLLSTGIVDNSNATAITIGSDESVTLAGTLSLPNANATNEISFTGTEFTNVLSATTSGFQLGTTGAGYLQFLTGNTARMTIDGGTGKVGIGTSPSHVLHVDASSTSTLVTIHNTNGSSSDCRGLDVETSTTGTTVQRWLNAGSELGRFTATGNLSVGTSGTGHRLWVYEAANAAQSTAQFRITGAGYSAFHFLDGTAYYIGQNSNSRSLRMYSGSNQSVGVQLNVGATSFGTFSDERLKQNIEPIEGAIESLSGLRTVKYHLKDADTSESTKRLGLIAQDLVGVLDEVIEPTTQAEDDTEYMAVRYTEIIPVLVKAIQEQQATIEALTQRIETLENNQ